RGFLRKRKLYGAARDDVPGFRGLAPRLHFGIGDQSLELEHQSLGGSMGLMSRGWKPKKLRDQTIVITGASSGIGLATARLAARRGARVVLTSRNEQDLRRAVDEIESQGGRATYVVADVAE